MGRLSDSQRQFRFEPLLRLKIESLLLHCILSLGIAD